MALLTVLHRALPVAIVLLLSSCGSQKPAAVQVAEVPVAKSEPAKLVVNVDAFWNQLESQSLPDLEPRIAPSQFSAWKTDFEAIKNQIASHGNIELPTPMGLMTYSLIESNTMSEALKAKFPDIKSYKGEAEGRTARVDMNAEGLFVEFSGFTEKHLLAPALKGSQSYYYLYPESALPSNPRDGGYR